MDSKTDLEAETARLAAELIARYGADAEAVAMLRAAEHAAALDIGRWQLWEAVLAEVTRRVHGGPADPDRLN